MKSVDFLVVGGSAAGTTAAEVIRSLMPVSSITVVTDENHEQYSRVLLPYYIRHKISREQVFLRKPEWYQERKIELIKGAKAVKLDPNKHLVTLSDGRQYNYGKLLFAVGGEVIRLNVLGSDLKNILYLRTIEDADQIVEVARRSKKAVIVGGGFVGLDFASCFKANGIEDVTILVLEDYFWQGKLDEESSKVLTATLEKNGIKILTNEEVERFEPQKGESFNKGFSLIKTKSGKKFEADVAGVGIGIKSDFNWLKDTGIKINRGIVTNEYLETSLADVYAAGDCAEFWDVIFQRQHIMGNWANATSQGNTVGKTMAGQRTVFETASSYSINFFDGSCSFIGVTDEKFADDVISRGRRPGGASGLEGMTRIFVKTINNVMRIVGATVINSVADVSPLTTAVKNRADIIKYKDKLGDEKFDLREIIS